jgi:ubiquitin carboxyl-terminal hydrolase 22/27/51
MQSDVVCNKCGNISRTIDPLRDISLDIPAYEVAVGQPPAPKKAKIHRKVNLKDCLQKFTRKEQLGNHSKINCR